MNTLPTPRSLTWSDATKTRGRYLIVCRSFGRKRVSMILL